MIDRRGFLKRFGIGVGAALALASLPASAIEGLSLPEAGKRIACEYLRRVHNDWCAAHPRQFPREMEAGRELFEAFEGELIACERFTNTNDLRSGVRSLKFKAADLRAVGRGWTAQVVA